MSSEKWERRPSGLWVNEAKHVYTAMILPSTSSVPISLSSNHSSKTGMTYLPLQQKSQAERRIHMLRNKSKPHNWQGWLNPNTASHMRLK